MALHPDLHVLVATPDHELSSDTISAIGQLSASCAVDLTVARVAGAAPDEATPRPMAFPADAAPRRTQRLELAGPDAARSVAALCAEQPFDLVLAPGETRPRAWRPFRRSFRSHLLDLAGTPVWTAGRDVSGRHFQRPLRTVACLIDFEGDSEPLLQRAAAFARRMEARLHVLAVLPPIDDGTLATVLTSDAPLLPAAAVDRIGRMCAARPMPAVDVVVDGLGRGLRRLVDMAAPDLLFVRAQQWMGRWPFGCSRQLDALRCPVVCVPDALALPGWSFERTAAERPWGQLPPAPAAARAAGPWPVGAATRLY